MLRVSSFILSSAAAFSLAACSGGGSDTLTLEYAPNLTATDDAADYTVVTDGSTTDSAVTDTVETGTGSDGDTTDTVDAAVPDTASTDFLLSAIEPNSRYEMNGWIILGDVATPYSTTIGNATTEFTTQSEGLLDWLEIRSGDNLLESLAVSDSYTYQIAGDFGSIDVIEFMDSDDDFVSIAAAVNGVEFDYQTFGRWVSAEGTVGAFSVGIPTESASAIPDLFYTYYYNGAAYGLYSTPLDQYETVSDLQVAVNGLLNTIEITAFDAVGESLTSGQVFNIPGAEFTGIGFTGQTTYQAEIYSVANAVLYGTLYGRFYGPTGEETGGLFKLVDGSGDYSYAGAFGARR